MGLQVYFEKEKALLAGAKFTLSFNKGFGIYEETYTIPGVEERCFNNYWANEDSFDAVKHGQVCTDFNDWGTNKEFIKPWLLENNIPFYVA
jgi:hypothetical protein